MPPWRRSSTMSPMMAASPWSASTSAGHSSVLGLIQLKNLTVRGCIGSPGVWPAAIRFLERTGIDLSLHPDVQALNDAVKGFELVGSQGLHQDHPVNRRIELMPRHALIAGVSGIIGRHLAEHLLGTKGWTVSGISRHKHDLPKGVKHIAVDLTDEEAVKAALKRVKPTDVFITTWLRQATEAENCRVNAGMARTSCPRWKARRSGTQRW